jgi:hypothetical protein
MLAPSNAADSYGNIKLKLHESSESENEVEIDDELTPAELQVHEISAIKLNNSLLQLRGAFLVTEPSLTLTNEEELKVEDFD